MKKIFLTLVAILSCTCMFAQDAEEYEVLVMDADLYDVNKLGAENGISVLEYSNFCLKQNGEVVPFEYFSADFAAGSEVSLCFSCFNDNEDYKMVGVELVTDDGTIDITDQILNNHHYDFVVNSEVDINVKIARTFYKYENTGTFVPMFDAVADMDMYEFEGVYGSQIYGVPTRQLKAGKPYIALPTSYLITYTPDDSGDVEFTSYNGFYPSQSDNTVVYGQESLIFYNGELCYANKNGNIVPLGKAYFNASEAIKTGIPSSCAKSVVFEDEVDGINGIVAGNVGKTNSNAVTGTYNMAGQQVSHAAKGLYIVNGKKVAIK